MQLQDFPPKSSIFLPEQQHFVSGIIFLFWSVVLEQTQNPRTWQHFWILCCFLFHLHVRVLTMAFITVAIKCRYSETGAYEACLHVHVCLCIASHYSRRHCCSLNDKVCYKYVSLVEWVSFYIYICIAGNCGKLIKLCLQ